MHVGRGIRIIEPFVFLLFLTNYCKSAIRLGHLLGFLLNKIHLFILSRISSSRCTMASLRKFPFSFGVGTDICQISRIYKIIAQKKGSNFIHRVLTKDEINSVRGASHVLEPIYSRRHLPESDLFPNGNIEEEIPAVATAARFMAGRSV